MILAIDIGNTNISFGLFVGERLIKRFSITSDTGIDTVKYIELIRSNIEEDIELEGAIIGSVVKELTNRIQYAILSQFGVKAHILSADSGMPITIDVLNKTELGADRIANGVAGYKMFPEGVIVIDFGTATTFDIVNSDGAFIGGLIAPGLGTQLESLTKSTSKLPKIDVEGVGAAIGNDTKSAILAGVVRGSACMADGMIESCISEIGEHCKIIVTGGYGQLVSKYMKTNIDIVCPDLTLEGLNLLFEQNRPIQPIFRH